MPSTRILPGEPGYPPSLLVLSKPEPVSGAPPALYVRGRLPDAAGIAVVGTRGPRREALAFTRELVHALAARGFCIWSGGAIGIDAAAHEAALEVGAPTVVVMGGGLDRPYPPENVPLFARVLDQGGALVARVADDVPPQVPGFIRRNEILAAATDATVVIEAGLKSGARSTAAAARRLGRPLCVVPHAPWDALGAGCALELVLGARAVMRAADVLEAIGAPLPSPPRRRRRAARATSLQLPAVGALGSSSSPPPPTPPPTSTRSLTDNLDEPGARARVHAHACVPKNGSAAEPTFTSFMPLSTLPPVLSQSPPSSNGGLSHEERVILRVLSESPLHIDEVCEAAGLPLPHVLSLLLTLTLQAVVVEGPAGYYRRPGG